MNKKILIADDEKDIVELLKVALERENFEVVVAFDGEEAKAKILTEQPSAILLDLMMPRLNGWEVLRWLREQEHSSTPTIIVSAKDEMKDIKKSYTLDADYYIIKPVSPKALIKGINTILSLKNQGVD